MPDGLFLNNTEYNDRLYGTVVSADVDLAVHAADGHGSDHILNVRNKMSRFKQWPHTLHTAYTRGRP